MVNIIGVDLAKNVFQLHGAAADVKPIPRASGQRGQASRLPNRLGKEVELSERVILSLSR